MNNKSNQIRLPQKINLMQLILLNKILFYNYLQCSLGYSSLNFPLRYLDIYYLFIKLWYVYFYYIKSTQLI